MENQKELNYHPINEGKYSSGSRMIELVIVKFIQHAHSHKEYPVLFELNYCRHVSFSYFRGVVIPNTCQCNEKMASSILECQHYSEYVIANPTEHRTTYVNYLIVELKTIREL